MKRFLLAIFAVSLVFCASEASAGSKRDRYIEKKNKERQKNKSSDQWHTDLPTALKESARTKRPILLLVTGSSWCGPCKNLEKKVLSNKVFTNYAKKNLILLKADIPRQKNSISPETQVILKKYYKGGVPAILILDSKGNIKESQGGYGGETPKNFIKRFKTLPAK